MSEPIKAKRGDLAVVVTTRRDFAIGQPVREREEVEVGRVTSITRDGIVKRVERATYGATDLARWAAPHRVYVLPKAQIDVDAAMEAATRNLWPSGHPGMPFESLAAVKAALRPYKRES